MIINDKILSIPPYVSTAWSNISSFHVEENGGKFLLHVSLKNETQVQIPSLDKSIIDKIFRTHADVAQKEDKAKNPMLSFGFPLKFGSENMDMLGSAMQHNPDQKNAPNLPKEILNKISGIARNLGIDDSEQFPKPELHCNCMHCQIAKSLQVGIGIHEENLDEAVSDDELQFKDWEIEQTNHHLFCVTNPLNLEEKYNVYLGEPIGCTCGKKNCEHIKAVLKS